MTETEGSVGMSVYLVWSNDRGAWWGPGGGTYRSNVFDAGRYDEAGARRACGLRTWPLGKPPPEVMVLAPENGKEHFTLDEIRALPALMDKRIKDATAEAIRTRAAASPETGPKPPVIHQDPGTNLYLWRCWCGETWAQGPTASESDPILEAEGTARRHWLSHPASPETGPRDEREPCTAIENDLTACGRPMPCPHHETIGEPR